MPDILHDFLVRADANDVFAAVSTPAGLDRSWTLASAGEPRRADPARAFEHDRRLEV